MDGVKWMVRKVVKAVTKRPYILLHSFLVYSNHLGLEVLEIMIYKKDTKWWFKLEKMPFKGFTDVKSASAPRSVEPFRGMV